MDVLERDSCFRCQASGLRLVTILAADRLADLMGATRQCSPRHRRASVAVALNLYILHKQETLERGSIFCRALRELSAEGGGEVRRASESAAQGDVKSGFVGIAKHRLRGLHS